MSSFTPSRSPSPTPSTGLSSDSDAVPLTGIGQQRDKDERITSEMERQIRRKLDFGLLPIISLLYMLSFLDRGNLGNARIAGMEADLDLYGRRYDNLLFIFYIAYILFQPCTLLYKVFRPHRYISCCVFMWGMFASLQSLVRNYTQLATLRFFLGVAEAAFGGVPFYLSFFYRPEELGFRVGVFICAAPLATTFAGSLAYLITSLSTPIAPWRLLLLIEGFPTCVAAVAAWFLVPDSPGTAYFLSSKEQRIAALRVSHDDRGVNLREVFQSMCDFKPWLIASMYFGSNVSFASLPVFLPTLIYAMGFDPRSSQGLSAPPYAVAFVAVILVAYFSDRTRQRGYFAMGASSIGSFGYLLQLSSSVPVRYLGVYFSAAGLFSVITILIPWTINNAKSQSKQGAAVSLVNFVGQFGPLVGTRLYPKTDEPRYMRGLSVCASFLALNVIIAALLRWRLAIENRRGGNWIL